MTSPALTGTVQIVLQDGQVIQIETSEKIRLHRCGPLGPSSITAD